MLVATVLLASFLIFLVLCLVVVVVLRLPSRKGLAVADLVMPWLFVASRLPEHIGEAELADPVTVRDLAFSA